VEVKLEKSKKIIFPKNKQSSFLGNRNRVTMLIAEIIKKIYFFLKLTFG